jgi:hypothetical protein
MNRTNAPCLGCTERTVGCHAVCTRGYLEFKEANEKRRDHINRIAEANAQAEAIKYRARKNMTHYARECT